MRSPSALSTADWTANIFTKPASNVHSAPVTRCNWNLETGGDGPAAWDGWRVRLPPLPCRHRPDGSSVAVLLPLSPSTGLHPLAYFWGGPGCARTGMQDVDHKREPCPHRIIDGMLIRWRGGGAGPPPLGPPRPPLHRGGVALPLVGVVWVKVLRFFLF